MYIQISPTDLKKRYYYYSSSGYSYRPWWIALIIVGIMLFIFALYFFARRRNFKRRNQGIDPLPYTGWTTYNWNGNQNQQQPYNPNASNTGYYNGSKEEQLPSYQQAQYQRPAGPPPGQQNSSDMYGSFQNPAPTGSSVIDNEYYGSSTNNNVQGSDGLSYPQQAYSKTG